ncbi:MAG TPA: DUF4350 domain-containing protein [Novosphingobium sp.]|nr:DUF4350 domain-containing protein [Novosphingobium sp.]
MSEAMQKAGVNPFSLRTVLLLVGLGSVVFVALLWMIGAGMMAGPVNDGGNHAGGRGLNGFAAFTRLLEDQGHTVRQVRTAASLDEPALLVLTPPHEADAEGLSETLDKRLRRGPTILVLPKWRAFTVPAGIPGSKAKEGWVALDGGRVPAWAEKLDTGPLDVRVRSLPKRAARWQGLGLTGRFPDPRTVQSLSSGRIVPIVRDGEGQALAGYLDQDEDSGTFPLLIVAEPDLLDNYGFARKENALLALSLVRSLTQGEDMPVLFDLTLNGHGRSANLLTLAFTPPFLAATLCLLMAALVVGWRAFLRFGTPRAPDRAIAFGKRALVANAAGLIRRTRRFHLISGPYLRRSRERIARSLAFPPFPTPDEADAAIDKVAASRAPDAPPYTAIATRLQAARKSHELLKAAQDLHALERTLIR